jgi:hypothetical protein
LARLEHDIAPPAALGESALRPVRHEPHQIAFAIADLQQRARQKVADTATRRRVVQPRAQRDQ